MARHDQIARLLDQINALADSNARERKKQLATKGAALARLLDELRVHYEQGSSKHKQGLLPPPLHPQPQPQPQSQRRLRPRPQPQPQPQNQQEDEQEDEHEIEPDIDLPFPAWALLHVRRDALEAACYSVHGQAVQRFQARPSEKNLGQSSIDNLCKEVGLTGSILCFLWHPDVVGSQIALKAVRRLQRQRDQEARRQKRQERKAQEEQVEQVEQGEQEEQVEQGEQEQREEQDPPPSGGGSLVAEITQRFHARVRANSSGPKRNRRKPLVIFQRTLVDMAGTADIWPVTPGTTRFKTKKGAAGQRQVEDETRSGDDLDFGLEEVGEVVEVSQLGGGVGNSGREAAELLQPQSVAMPERGRKHMVQPVFRPQSLSPSPAPSPLPSPSLSPFSSPSPPQSRIVSPSSLQDNLGDIEESHSPPGKGGESGSEDKDESMGMCFQDDSLSDSLHMATASARLPLPPPPPSALPSGCDMPEHTSAEGRDTGDIDMHPGQTEGKGQDQDQDQGVAGATRQTALSLARLKQGDLDHDHNHDCDRDHNLGHDVQTEYSSIAGDSRRRPDHPQHRLTPVKEADHESSTILEVAVSSPHKRPRTPEPEAHASTASSQHHNHRRGLCFPSLPLSTPPSQVVEALGRNKRLTSDEIALCLHFYFRQAEQSFPSDITIFDPGFPFNQTETATSSPVIQHPERLTRRLIFIFNHEEHWTVGYLDRSQDILLHFDSAQKRNRMSLDWAKKYMPSWLATSNIVDTPVQVREPKSCPPQQKDSYNCGIFAISFAVSLAMNGEVDRVVDPSHVRRSIASMLQKVGAEPEATTKADLSCQATNKWHLGGDGCGGEGEAEMEELRDTRRKRPRRDTSLPAELAQSLGHHPHNKYEQHQEQQRWQGDPEPTASPRSDISPQAYTTTTDSSSGGRSGSGQRDPADAFLPPQAVTTDASMSMSASISMSTSTSTPTSIQHPGLGPAMAGTANKCEQATEAETNTGSTVHLANDMAPVPSSHQHETSQSVAADSVQLGDLVGQLDPHLPPTLSGQALLGLVGSYLPVAQAEANKQVAAAKSLQARLQYEIGQITQEINDLAQPSASKSVTAVKNLHLDGNSGDAPDAQYHERHQHEVEEAEEEKDAVTIAQAQLVLSQARCRELQATMTEHKAKADELRRRVSSLRPPSTTTMTKTTTIVPASSPDFQGHTHNSRTASSPREDDGHDNDDDDAALEAWARDAEVLTSQISECIARRREAHRLSTEAQAEARAWARRIDALAAKHAEMEEKGREIARLSWLQGWVDRLGDMCRPDQAVVLPGSGSRRDPLA